VSLQHHLPQVFFPSRYQSKPITATQYMGVHALGQAKDGDLLLSLRHIVHFLSSCSLRAWCQSLIVSSDVRIRFLLSDSLVQGLPSILPSFLPSNSPLLILIPSVACLLSSCWSQLEQTCFRRDLGQWCPGRPLPPPTISQILLVQSIRK
jgi:hypothetical protein